MARNAQGATQKHEYLKEEDYYEARSVGSGRSDKTCEHCGGTIKKGTPHLMHHFYPEFTAYATHEGCADDFKASLRTEKDEEPVAVIATLKIPVRVIVSRDDFEDPDSVDNIAEKAVAQLLKDPKKHITADAMEQYEEDEDTPYDAERDGEL
jgi:hypothetical protein